jgi:hypothetical protein
VSSETTEKAGLNRLGRGQVGLVRLQHPDEIFGLGIGEEELTDGHRGDRLVALIVPAHYVAGFVVFPDVAQVDLDPGALK